MAIVSRGQDRDPYASQNDAQQAAFNGFSQAAGQFGQLQEQRRGTQLAALEQQANALMADFGGRAFEIAPDIMNQWASLAGVDPRIAAEQIGWNEEQERNYVMYADAQERSRAMLAQQQAQQAPGSVPYIDPEQSVKRQMLAQRQKDLMDQQTAATTPGQVVPSVPAEDGDWILIGGQRVRRPSPQQPASASTPMSGLSVGALPGRELTAMNMPATDPVEQDFDVMSSGRRPLDFRTIYSIAGNENFEVGIIMDSPEIQALQVYAPEEYARLEQAAQRGNRRRVQRILRSDAVEAAEARIIADLSRGVAQRNEAVAAGQSPTITTDVITPRQHARQVINDVQQILGQVEATDPVQAGNEVAEMLSPEAEGLYRGRGSAQFVAEFGDRVFQTPHGPMTGVQLDWFRNAAIDMKQGNDPLRMLADDGTLQPWQAQSGPIGQLPGREAAPAASATDEPATAQYVSGADIVARRTPSPTTDLSPRDRRLQDLPPGGPDATPEERRERFRTIFGIGQERRQRRAGREATPQEEEAEKRETGAVMQRIRRASERQSQRRSNIIEKAKDLPTAAAGAIMASEGRQALIGEAAEMRQAAGGPLYQGDALPTTMRSLAEFWDNEVATRPWAFPNEIETRQTQAQREMELAILDVERQRTQALLGDDGRLDAAVAEAIRQNPQLANSLTEAQTLSLLTQALQYDAQRQAYLAEIDALEANGEVPELTPERRRELEEDESEIQERLVELYANDELSPEQKANSIQMYQRQLNDIYLRLGENKQAVYVPGTGRLGTAPARFSGRRQSGASLAIESPDPLDQANLPGSEDVNQRVDAALMGLTQ